jgi:hypothetical protein
MIYFTNKWNPMSLDVVRCCLRPDESLDLVLRPADTVYDTLYKIFRSKFKFQFPNCDARDSMTFPVEAVRGVEPEVEKVTNPITGEYLGIQIIFLRFCANTTYSDIFSGLNGKEEVHKNEAQDTDEAREPPLKKPKLE